MKSFAVPAWVLFTAAFLLTSTLLMAIDSVTVAELLQHPERHDRKFVRVTGTIASYREKRSVENQVITRFRLTDGEDSVKVYGEGDLNFQNGYKVEIEGIFHDGEISLQRIVLLKA